MPANIHSAPREPHPETVDALLAELRRLLDKQLEAIDSLDAKAGVTFGAAGLVATLTIFVYGDFLQKAALEAAACRWLLAGLRGGLLVSVALSVATICSILRALRVLAWQLPLDPGEVEDDYLAMAPPQAKGKLLASYIKYAELNTTTMHSKAGWVQKSLCLLAANLICLMVLVIVGALNLPV